MNTHFSNFSRILVITISALFGVVSTVSADFSQKDWRAYKEIKIPSVAQSTSLVQVVLDPQVFASSTTHLSDLRVVDAGDNKEVPYLLITDRDTVQTTAPTTQILNKGSVAGEYTSFVVDFGGSARHNQININIDAEQKNYRKKVQIYGSNDMGRWSLLADNQIIYDYSRDYPVRNTTVSYPEAVYRYVMVKIIDSDSDPVLVLGASARRDVYARGNRLSYFPTFEVVEVGKDTQIIADFRLDDGKTNHPRISPDFGDMGAISDQFAISTDSRNFERSVSVYSSADKKVWSYIGGDAIYQYKTKDLSGEKTLVSFGESNARYVKILIHNQDSQPIKINDLEFRGYVRVIKFLAEPQHNYKLFYGNEKAVFPSYDLAQVYRNFKSDEFISGNLEAERVNGEYVPPVIPLSERAPWIIWIMLGIAVLVLGAVIFRVVQRTAGLPETQ